MRHQDNRAEFTAEMLSANHRLKALLSRLAPEEGKFPTAVNGLLLTRWNDTSRTDTCFYAPAVGLIVQGRKESRIGNEIFRYGELDCLVNGVDLPSRSKIIEATPEKPLLAVSLTIDRGIAMDLAAEIPPGSAALDPLGVSVAPAGADLLASFARLVEVLDKPAQIALRAPLLIREITALVLLGPQGASLRRLYTAGSHSNQIAEAISWLRKNYTLPLRVEELASRAGMATSTFHRQFKKLTSLSPLQYQKCQRLYAARRLLLSENLDANSAGRAVGYENAQQFNREYKRLFGEPPLRDIRRLRKD